MFVIPQGPLSLLLSSRRDPLLLFALIPQGPASPFCLSSRRDLLLPLRPSRSTSGYTLAMTVESTRAFLLTLPHVVEIIQSGDNLVFWVGDKAIGGKMFALIDLDPARSNHPVISFPVGPEAYGDLLETRGLLPAPYLARIHWIAASEWTVFSTPEWHDRLRRAHALTLAKLTPRARTTLALPPAEQRRAITARRHRLSEREQTLAKPVKSRKR